MCAKIAHLRKSLRAADVKLIVQHQKDDQKSGYQFTLHLTGRLVRKVRFSAPKAIHIINALKVDELDKLEAFLGELAGDW